MSGLRPRTAFEIANGLHWVRGEIEVSLGRARAAIEHYLDLAGDHADIRGDLQPLHTAAAELRLVRGSLSLIECFGAGMLAQEMLLLLEALIAGRAQPAQEAFAALSGATLQLSDYVDLLAHGAADRVLVLQPVVNELRLAGGRPLSTEAEMFAQQLQVQTPPAAGAAPTPSSAAQALAKRELTAMQSAFLQWFRGQNVEAALLRVARIADSVAVNVAAPALAEFWSSCAALSDCLRQQAQDTLDLKRFYGRAVAQLKLLADGGETAALAQLGDAPQQALFHIARAPRPSDRAVALIAGLRLDVLLPSLPQITDLRRRLRGPNTTILNRVYAEIRRDFTALKDAIDLAVRTRGRTSADLGATRERLRRMAQTVGALGLPAAQSALLNQSLIVAELPPGAPEWMDTATAILRVEHSLEEALFRALGRAGEAASRDYAEIAAEIPHGQDLRESIAALVRECLVEFSLLKNAVDAYLKQGEPAALLDAPQRLHDIGAALQMLGQTRAADMLARLQHYVAEGRLAASKHEPGGFERFADAVSSAESFFEALRDGLPSPERLLDDVAAYVDRLGAVARPSPAARISAAPLIVELDWQAPAIAPLTPASIAAVPGVAAPSAAIPAPVSGPVGQGIDPEIRDIFIEEAGEVLAEVQRRLPQLRRDPGNREALVDVRRAFHTLKGSGRMAGALRIGEFAYAVEDLLNRCLSGSISLRPPLLELLDDTSALLPRLIENFRDGGLDTVDVVAVIERAARLAAGDSGTEPALQAVFREDARDRLGFVRRWLDAQRPGSGDGTGAGDVAVEPEIARSFHTLRGSAAVVQAQGIHELSALIENYLNSVRARGQALPPAALVLLADTLLLMNGWLDGGKLGGAHAAELAEWRVRIDALLALTGTKLAATPAIDEAFSSAALDALQSLEAQARQWSQQPAVSAAMALRAGFAGLAGSAEKAAAAAVVRLAQAIAGRLSVWPADAVPGAGFFAGLLELFEGLYQQLDAYRDGSAADTGDWLARVQTLARPPPAAPPSEPAPVSISAPPPAPLPLPPTELELQALFRAEAFSMLQAVDRQQSAWADGDPTAVDALRLGLYTLKGSAHAAGVFAIGEVAQQLEYELELLDAHSIAPLQWRVAKGIEGLHRLLGQLQRGEALDAASVLDDIGRTGLRAPPDEVVAGGTFESRAETALPALFESPDNVPGIAGDEGAIAIENAVLAESALALLEPPSVPDQPAVPASEISTPIDAGGAAPGAAPAAIGGFTELSLDSMFDEAESDARGLTPVEAAFDLRLDALDLPPAAPIRLDAPLIETAAEAAQADAALFPLSLEAVTPEAPEAPAASPPVPSAASAFAWPAAPATSAIAPLAFAPPADPAPPHQLDYELTDIFAAEAGELLEALDSGFELWQNGYVPGRAGDDDGEALRDVQRALHTLKGGARMSGLDAMGDAAHALESQVNAVTASGAFPDPATFLSLREAFDGLQRMHDQLRRGEAELLAAPRSPQPSAPQPAISLPSAPLSTPAPVPPQPAIEAATPSTPALSGWLPELFWRPEEALGGLSAARRETARVPVEALDAMLNETGEISLYRSRLEERNSGVRTQLAEMSQTITRVRDQLRMMEFETEAQIAARGLKSDLVRAADRYEQDFDPLEMDRFSRMQELSRALAESVNDLAALQATMSDAVRETETLLLQQSRINSEVQQGLMSTLMVPFSRQVQRLLRVVRQTAQENGKQADVQFTGAEAELDRNVLERITAPLEHLLRNAVVHGIEDPAQRAFANKPLVGAISVKLQREGSQLLVEVSDDGAGLDLLAIRDKAIERGLMAPQAQLSDGDLARFIFEPGFSTAKILTQDAGRGIGMDVVASEVKQLGGTLELHSQIGEGARFGLRLPLTLAVSQALMVGVSTETYALPLPSVEGIARIPRGDFADLARADGPLFAYGGRGYRVRHLAEYLELPQAPNADARSLTAILVRLGDDLGSGERRVALVVDQLLGNRDIVTKPVGPQVSSVAGVAGATLLADGRVVLILDVPALVAEHARRALLSDTVPGGTGDAAANAPRVAEVLDTVMVVDDSVTMRRVAERLLLRNGYRVVTARDGLDAIAMLATETPVALLLDIEMPRADGFEVASFVRNNARLKTTPIIMITSRSGEKHRERARVLGVDRYLIKPYQEEALLAEVKSVLAVA